MAMRTNQIFEKLRDAYPAINADHIVDMLCEYIDNQDSSAALQDFISEKIDQLEKTLASTDAKYLIKVTSIHDGYEETSKIIVVGNDLDESIRVAMANASHEDDWDEIEWSDDGKKAEVFGGEFIIKYDSKEVLTEQEFNILKSYLPTFYQNDLTAANDKTLSTEMS
jgi:hypothetical protein